eukprot:TRINITY_DN8448_c0_g1_i1.p1 TRINITY_DN8448_c0_g1~~TRINITY_DN8448_c0_g1_i1.p1  ORF type:complete len:1989 (+),score=221.56 TRINITY_DN8448_c0_g1_i1:23-5968(+)
MLGTQFFAFCLVCLMHFVFALPTVTQITGCAVNGPKASGCRGGQSITISGTNFAIQCAYNKVSFTRGVGLAPVCGNITRCSASSIECPLIVPMGTRGQWYIYVQATSETSSSTITVDVLPGSVVVNGNFDYPTQGRSPVDLPPLQDTGAHWLGLPQWPGSGPTKWFARQGTTYNAELSPFTSHSSPQSLSLHAYCTDENSFGGAYQQFPTTTGALYSLRFWAACGYGGDRTGYTQVLGISGVLLEEKFQISVADASNPPAAAYEEFQFFFRADGTTAQLAFWSDQRNCTNIDDVVVLEVTEHSWPLTISRLATDLRGAADGTAPNGAVFGVDGVQLNGIDQYVQLGAMSLGVPFTIRVYIKLNSLSTDFRVLSLEGTAGTVFVGNEGPGNGLVFQVYSGILRVPDFWTVGSWALVTLTVAQDGAISAYRDNILLGSVAGSTLVLRHSRSFDAGFVCGTLNSHYVNARVYALSITSLDCGTLCGPLMDPSFEIQGQNSDLSSSYNWLSLPVIPSGGGDNRYYCASDSTFSPQITTSAAKAGRQSLLLHRQCADLQSFGGVKQRFPTTYGTYYVLRFSAATGYYGRRDGWVKVMGYSATLLEQMFHTSTTSAGDPTTFDQFEYSFRADSAWCTLYFWSDRGNCITVDEVSIVEPTLQYITGCSNGNGNSATGCSHGTTITIGGENFHKLVDKNQVILLAAGGSGQAPTCTIKKVTSVSVECLLAVPGATRGTWGVQLLVLGGSATNRLYLDVLPPPTPTLSFVLGCTFNGVHATGCKTGAVVTIGGSNFDETTPANNIIRLIGGQGTEPRCDIRTVTRVTVECLLRASPDTAGTWSVWLRVFSSNATGNVTLELAPNSVRLVGGNTEFGRVETRVGAQWGSVCSTGFGMSDADVVCRQLGFFGAARTIPSFGGGTGPILMTNVECSGTEYDLLECAYDALTADCTHAMDVGVQCMSTPTPIPTSTPVPTDTPTIVRGIVNVFGNKHAEGDGPGGSISMSSWKAVSFTLRQWPLSVRGVMLKISGLRGATVSVSLRRASDSGGPGVVVAKLTTISPAPNGLSYSWYLFSSATPIGLEAGATYWLVVSGTSTVSVQWSTPLPEALPTGLYADVGEYRLSTDSGATWVASVTYNSFEILAATPTPIPTATPVPTGTPTPLPTQPARVRLAGESRLRGRLEVLYNGEWGSVCDDFFSLRSAAVVCSELGLGDAVEYIYRYGGGTGRIHFDDVRCTGAEASIFDCPHITENNCNHDEDVGVECRGTLTPIPTPTPARTATPTPIATADKPIRLVGSKLRGRLEVLRNGEWGTVCGDGFSKADAVVACRQLQLGDPVDIIVDYGRVDPGWSWIHLSHVNCTGKELSLADCPAKTSPSDCTHTQDIGLECTATHSPTPTATPVPTETPSPIPTSAHLTRFSSSDAFFSGRVEVFYFDKWNALCGDSFVWDDAMVVCRELGYGEPIETRSISAGSQITMLQAECQGREKSLQSCKLSPAPQCNRSRALMVQCQGYCLTNQQQRCALPFVYNGQRYDSCTMVDSDVAWCSLTDNYDKDSLWAPCDCTTCSCASCTTDAECEEGNPCTQNYCAGTCQYHVVPGCDRPDTKCTGVVCKALDQCHTVGRCDNTTGVCSNPTKTDGAPCDDEDPETLEDRCRSGACVGVTPLPTILSVLGCPVSGSAPRCVHASTITLIGAHFSTDPQANAITFRGPAPAPVCKVQTSTVSEIQCKLLFPSPVDPADKWSITAVIKGFAINTSLSMQVATESDICDENTCSGKGSCRPDGTCDCIVEEIGGCTYAYLGPRCQRIVKECAMCVGVSCPAPPPCREPGYCNATTGACVYPWQPDGTACDDNDPKTSGEQCASGACSLAGKGGAAAPGEKATSWALFAVVGATLIIVVLVAVIAICYTVHRMNSRLVQMDAGTELQEMHEVNEVSKDIAATLMTTTSSSMPPTDETQPPVFRQKRGSRPTDYNLDTASLLTDSSADAKL